MTEQQMNCKHKYGSDLRCPLCHKSDARTEHVLSCDRIPKHQFVHEDLMHADSMDDWQELTELYESSEKMRTVSNLRVACVQTLI